MLVSDNAGSSWQLPGLQRTTLRGYDAAGNLVLLTMPRGYDLDGQGNAVAHPASVTTRYGYDALNRRTDEGDAYLVNGQPTDLTRTTHTDFDAAEGDRIQLDPRTVWHASQQGANVVVDLDGGGELILRNTRLDTFGAGWIFTA